MLKVILPDGKTLEYSRRVRPIDIAAEIGPRLAKATLAAEVDGQLVGADELLPADGQVALRLITSKDPQALDLLRHSCAHVMARAVMRLFEGVQLAFGPTVADGFYYDFQMEHALSEADFPKIEAEMARIVKEDEPFERVEMDRARGDPVLPRSGPVAEGRAPGGRAGRRGDRLVLSAGRVHRSVPRSARAQRRRDRGVQAAVGGRGLLEGRRLAPAVAAALRHGLLQQAGPRRPPAAGRRGQAPRPSRAGQATRTVHDRSGRRPGLVFWLPKGAVVRHELENFLYAELIRRGYQPVNTPVIGNVHLYETSGHYPYYKDSQFPPIEMADGERYLLRPMNCPHHITIYKSKPRSYRDLPLRLAEFGTVHRFEQSGELNGMTRVRGFTQDDAHIFCTEEQVADEFRGCLDMTQFVLKTLGLDDYRVRLGFRDPASDKYVGSAETWQRAEAALEQVCGEMDLPNLHIERGEAAFYGPKADFVVADCIGREWQLGTVQLDYNLPSPQRFGLEYIGADNTPHQPVMIHRAPFGSFERFVGMLIEHFAGAFPLWLAPEQVRVMVVSQKVEEYGRQRRSGNWPRRACASRGDYRAEKIGAKIRDAQLELIPYMFVIGGREAEEGKVAVRDRLEGDLGAMPLAAAIEQAAGRDRGEDDAARRRRISGLGISGYECVLRCRKSACQS